jgi:hypothetical protein
MAVSFLESLSNLQGMMRDPNSSGSEIFFAGAGMAVVTLALLAFKYWGGETIPPVASRSQRGQEPY